MRYIQVYRNLEEAYDQLVHPQKREDLKLALDATMSRMIILKRQLIHISPLPGFQNYLDVDQFLPRLQLAPEDLEIAQPHHFLMEDTGDQTMIDMMMQFFDEAGSNCPVPQDESIRVENADTYVMSLEEAVKIIIRNERGRQCKQRALVVKTVYMEENRVPSTLTRNEASIRIQTQWKTFKAKQEVHIEKEKELVFLRMGPQTA